MEKLQPSPHLPSSMRNVHRMCLFTLSWRGSGCRKWQLGHGEAVHREPSVSFCQLQTQQDMAAQLVTGQESLPASAVSPSWLSGFYCPDRTSRKDKPLSS